MMELLLPAGSPEAVTAAVQSGADAVYLSLNELTDCRKTVNFSDSEFEAAVRYCRVRGCRVYFALNSTVFEDELPKAAGYALRAQRAGADAVIVRDLGVVSVLRRLLPDMPLFADYRLSFVTPEGLALAAGMGFSRVFLPPETPMEEILRLSRCGVELAVFVQTSLCIASAGTCHMSALANRESADRGLCSELCREKYTLGGRWDDTPLSFKDRCLVHEIETLKEAGIASVCLGNRERRSEYAAAYAGMFRQAISESRQPPARELEELDRLFLPYGTAEKEIFEPAGEKRIPERGTEKACTAIRKKFSETEERRVNVNFAVLAVSAAEPVKLGAQDEEGRRAVIDGPVPREDGDVLISDEGLAECMYRTAGTPFRCTGVKAAGEKGMKVSGMELDMARRSLLYKLSEERSKIPERTEGAYPSPVTDAPHPETPGAVFSFQNAGQMTADMAELQPVAVYVPAEVLLAHPEKAELFRASGAEIVCELPGAVRGESEEQELAGLLQKLRAMGVTTALAGNWSVALIAAGAGFRLRGDTGLQVTNAMMLQSLDAAGFISAALSPELTLEQVRGLPKPMDTELVVYGRLPAMITEKCLIRASAGRCTCTTPGQMADTHGGVWPVTKHFGCRNTLWSNRKLWLGDVARDWVEAGLWAGRLSFTTESPRECLEVANSYLRNTGYRPNGMTRGLYYRGVL